MKKDYKEFLMTLAATTVSIVLTFGTNAIVERHKQNKEKREMVMMIMYDMRESLREIEQINQDLKAFYELQVDVVAHPEKLASSYVQFASLTPYLRYTTTTENIFRSNIETIRTIGSILFLETVSSFYDERAQYKENVADAFSANPDALATNYELLRDFNSPSYIFYGESLYAVMSANFEQCKLMMKVTEKELEVFSLQQQKLLEITRGNATEEATQSSLDNVQRKARLEAARH